MEAHRPGRTWSRLWARGVDASPVLAKELLVTVRTPTYVGSILVAPIFLGALVLLVRLAIGAHFDPYAGRRLFSFYFVGLALVLGATGAGLGSNSMVQERETGALEALKFSQLGVRRIVLGKLAAVVFAQAAIALATLPLLALVFAMGGVSVAEALVGLGVAIGCGVMTASAGIAVAAHIAQGRRSQLVSLLGSGVLAIGVIIWFAAASQLTQRGEPFDLARSYETAKTGDAFVLLWVLPVYAFASVVWFGHAVAVSGLMDASDERGTPIQRWMVGASFLGVVALLLTMGASTESVRSEACGSALMAIASVAVALLFAFAGAPLEPTRRMQARPHGGGPRAVYPRCLAPSLLFLLGVAALDLLAICAAGGSPVLAGSALWTAAALAAFGGLLGAVAARHGAKLARLAGAGVLLTFVLAIAFLREDARGPSLADALCPIWVAGESAARAQGILAGSLVGWAAAALVAVGAMLGAARAATRRKHGS